MSAINGNKARFHRERKKQIQRRLRKQKMLNALAKPPIPAAPPERNRYDNLVAEFATFQPHTGPAEEKAGSTGGWLYHAKRELRAEAMRRLGMDVDCACDISEARSWWRADLITTSSWSTWNTKWTSATGSVATYEPLRSVSILRFRWQTRVPG